MNIWMLHPFAGGPGLGRHWRPYLLADAWQRMGHRPLVISADAALTTPFSEIVFPLGSMVLSKSPRSVA